MDRVCCSGNSQKIIVNDLLCCLESCVCGCLFSTVASLLGSLQIRPEYVHHYEPEAGIIIAIKH